MTPEQRLLWAAVRRALLTIAGGFTLAATAIRESVDDIDKAVKA